jgi:hypothetical protein
MSLEHSPARERYGRPRYQKIARAIDYSGISRSQLYVLAAQHSGLFVKNGDSTLVNFDILDTILDGFPPAEIKPAAPRKTAASS